MIETRLLHYFLAVAREQSFTKAAESLHLSQPTLSKQLSDLEKQLGKQLFIRSKKIVTLTPEGQYLRSRANEIVELMQQTETLFQTDEDLIGGDIYLGCGETPAIQYIFDIFQKMQADHPQVRLHVRSQSADETLEQLDKGLLEIGIIFGRPVPTNKYNYWKLPFGDHQGLLMPKDCPLAQKDVITKEDLPTIPLVTPYRFAMEPQHSGLFAFDPEALHIVATYNLLYNAIYMVRQGIGYALTATDVLNSIPYDDLVCRPFDPALEMPLHLITKKNHILSPAAKIFLTRLQEGL